MIDREKLKEDLKMVYDAFDVFVIDLADKLVIENDDNNSFILEFKVFSEIGGVKEYAGGGTMRFEIGDINETA